MKRHQCKKCGSTNVRAYDNEPLSFRTMEESKEENYDLWLDDEILIHIVCDACSHSETVHFELVHQRPVGKCDIFITWENTLNSRSRMSRWEDGLVSVVNLAKEIDYPFITWNDKIYYIDRENDDVIDTTYAVDDLENAPLGLAFTRIPKLVKLLNGCFNDNQALAILIEHKDELSVLVEQEHSYIIFNHKVSEKPYKFDDNNMGRNSDGISLLKAIGVDIVFNH